MQRENENLHAFPKLRNGNSNVAGADADKDFVKIWGFMKL